MTALMRMMMRALAVYLLFVAFAEEDEKTSFEEAIFMSDLIPSNFIRRQKVDFRLTNKRKK